jgi:hypothetical protein
MENQVSTESAPSRAGYRWETSAAANIRFSVPAAWVSRSDGQVLVVTSPEPAVGIEFVGITGGAPQGKAVEEEIFRAVGRTIQGIEITTPAKPVEQFGLTGFIFGGNGTKEGQPIHWFSVILGGGHGKGVLAVGFIRATELAAQKATLIEVLNSIQPVIPEATQH